MEGIHKFNTIDEYNKEMGVETLRSEEHKSELQSRRRISYAVCCLKKKKKEKKKKREKKKEKKDRK